MNRILVVANRTLCEQHLLDELNRRKHDGPIEVHLLVPASHPAGAWTDAQSEEGARQRLDQMLDIMAIAGIRAEGEIGDASPVIAVLDLQRRGGLDGIDDVIVSTLPAGTSRWLAGNVIRRIRSATGLPVTHVVAETVTAPTS
jgi:hypothetical protein